MLLVKKACRACQREFTGGEQFCPDDGTRLSPRSRIDARGPADALVGVTLDGRYRVLRLIGEGGMGFVYEAEHVSLDKRVAIKVLRDDFSRRPDVVARFHQEARSASRIGHANIVGVIDYGETPGGASYFVMEMLDGEDLADRLSREVTLPSAMAAHIARECCAALAAAHDKGIIHRDIKPENVFLVEREGDVDLVKLVDFGVAKMMDEEARSGGRKLTRTGMVFGTPEYMSPEQAAGNPPDHRVDIYSLGIILYEMVTGRVPFEGDNFMQVLNRHASKPVPPMREANRRCTPSAELEAVVMRALAKRPEGRFASMAAMAAALDATPELLAGSPRVSGRVPVGQRVPSPVSVTRVALTGNGEAESPARPLHTPEGWRPRPPWARPAWLALFGAAALTTAGLLWLSRSQQAPARDASARAAVQSSPPAAAGPAKAATDEDVEPEDEVAEGVSRGKATHVSVRVSTEPSGAKLIAAGLGEVCPATPCSFEAEAGKALSLMARRGRARATGRVTAKEGAELHLVLETPVTETASSSRTPLSAPDDLKVPAIFRDKTR